jgi:hypothetical protein
MIAKIASGVVAFALLGGLTAMPARAVGESSGPIRHLVYNFTYTSTQTQTLHSSGIGGATDNGGEMGKPGPGNTSSTESPAGSTSYAAALNDKGTITIDIMAVQSDTGIDVNVSEASDKSRSADVASCVVYGNTNVLCDPNAKINAEEFAVIALLGRGFVSPAQLDAQNHWRVANSGPQLTVATDFTIDRSTGDIFQISSVRVTEQRGAQGFSATQNGKITYDNKRTVPTEITEDETTRTTEGSDSYSETRVQTSFELATDSLAGTP